MFHLISLFNFYLYTINIVLIYTPFPPKGKVKSYRENAYTTQGLRFGDSIFWKQYISIRSRAFGQPGDPYRAAVRVGKTADSVVN